jgi:hypothetical protein
MKLIKIASLTAATMLASTGLFAADQNVQVDAQFRPAIVLALNSSVDLTPGATFIDYAGTPGGSDLVNIGTDGNITVGGTVFTAPAAGTVGSVTITGDGSSAVNISCNTAALLRNAGGNGVTFNTTQISMNTGDPFGSSDDPCGGLGTSPLAHTLDGTDVVLIGGRIDAGVGGTIVSGTVYSTTIGTGSPIILRVVYQ